MAMRGLGEHEEVARGILGRPEGGSRHPARRIVDPAHEREPGSPALEPVVAAAVDLEQESLPGHPVAPAPVARRTPATDRGKPRRIEDPAQGPLGHRDPFALREQLGQVRPVDPRVHGPGELDQSVPQVIGCPMSGHAPGVAMDQACEPLGPKCGQQPADLAHREPQDPRRLVRGDPAGIKVLQDVEAPLRPGIHPDRVPRLHAIEGDKVTGRLRGDTFTGR
jgi:hypothetical protein